MCASGCRLKTPNTHIYINTSIYIHTHTHTHTGCAGWWCWQKKPTDEEHHDSAFHSLARCFFFHLPFALATVVDPKQSKRRVNTPIKSQGWRDGVAPTVSPACESRYAREHTQQQQHHSTLLLLLHGLPWRQPWTKTISTQRTHTVCISFHPSTVYNTVIHLGQILSVALTRLQAVAAQALHTKQRLPSRSLCQFWQASN